MTANKRPGTYDNADPIETDPQMLKALQMALDEADRVLGRVVEESYGMYEPTSFA